MDPLSTITSLCSLAVTIITWIDQMRDKKETFVEIGKTVSTIHAILLSFQNNTKNIELEPALLNAFVGLGDILSRTREHISAYKKSRRSASIDTFLDFLVPARVSQQLIRDEEQLSHQLTIILFSFSSYSFIREHLPEKKADLLTFRAIRNEDVFEFWRDYLGTKVLYARSDRFLDALRYRFGNRLNDAARRRLFLRLDEFRIGGVAASTLERFVGDGSLDQAVEDFESFEASSPLHEPLATDARLPLLIWVDDKPENNVAEVQFAKQAGVRVIEFASTALLKAWIEQNEDFLRENDNADSIRFISDTARFETEGQRNGPTDSAYFNLTAGENIARYLRGHLYRAPLLIFCGGGIIFTHYVKSYEATGSTCRSAVVRDYIMALSQRRGDDEGWQGYNVSEDSTAVFQ
ncbi:hypothetical protein H0H93_001918 [Arthromyces matolae]|nr:hypothetical protein H0H93_001918 [Arthromyces matolae]